MQNFGHPANSVLGITPFDRYRSLSILVSSFRDILAPSCMFVALNDVQIGGRPFQKLHLAFLEVIHGGFWGWRWIVVLLWMSASVSWLAVSHLLPGLADYTVESIHSSASAVFPVPLDAIQPQSIVEPPPCLTLEICSFHQRQLLSPPPNVPFGDCRIFYFFPPNLFLVFTFPSERFM